MAFATVTIWPTPTAEGAPTPTPFIEVAPVPDLNIPLFISLGVVALVISIIAFSLRIYVRRVMIRQVGKDDYVYIASFVSLVLLVILYEAILINLNAKGVTEEFNTTMGLGNIWVVLCAFVTVIVRGAIAAFFLRIIPEQKDYKWHRITLIAVFVIYGLFMVIGPFLALFSCGTEWQEIDYEYSVNCIDLRAIENTFRAGVILTAAVDWIMVLIPLIIVWTSTLSKRTKIPAMLVIALGSLGSVTSIVRIPLISLAEVLDARDLGHYLVYLVLALFDNVIAFLAVSLAALRPLVQKYRKDPSTNMSATFHSSRRLGDTQRGDKHNNNIMYLTEFEVTKSPRVGSEEQDSIDKVPMLHR